MKPRAHAALSNLEPQLFLSTRGKYGNELVLYPPLLLHTQTTALLHGMGREPVWRAQTPPSTPSLFHRQPRAVRHQGRAHTADTDTLLTS